MKTGADEPPAVVGLSLLRICAFVKRLKRESSVRREFVPIVDVGRRVFVERAFFTVHPVPVGYLAVFIPFKTSVFLNTLYLSYTHLTHPREQQTEEARD